MVKRTNMNKYFAPDGVGCTDGNCIFRDNTKGMHTNAGCSCCKELMRTVPGRDALMLINHLKCLIGNDTVDILIPSGEYITTRNGIGVVVDGKINTAD